MKVLFTFFNPSGGMETLNRMRSRALIHYGLECHLLYTSDGEGDQNIKGIPTVITNDDDQLRRLLDRESYDVIVVCSDIVLLEKMRNMGYAGILIFEVQGLGPIETARKLIDDFTKPLRRNADALLYPNTNHLRELLSSRFPEIPQFCFDDPIDSEQFYYVAYPVKPFPIIGWIGRLEKNKNWREFLQIGSQMVKCYPDLYLWMFHDATLSEPSEQANFNDTVRTLKLNHRLICYSNVPHDQMMDYLSIIGDSGGFLCSTSITEGFGYAVAEAMLCRCPVLATDSDGIRRLLQHNQTGKYYQIGSIYQAVTEGLYLMNNKKLRKVIVDSAEEHVKKNFSTAKYVENFCGMLTNLEKKIGGLRSQEEYTLKTLSDDEIKGPTSIG